MNILICPVCGGSLEKKSNMFCCERNHCFDVAKEGYVNLLGSRKAGDNTGDNKEMARSRRTFLDKGYYAPLAEAVGECLEKYSDNGDTVLDICCGEGYYTAYLAERLNRQFYGFDLSKNMVRLASKRKAGMFFVANIAAVPVASGSVKAAFHLFAPFHAGEFARVISDDGVVITAIPGARHLCGLKEVLYDEPYLNDEKPPEAEGLKLLETVRVRGEISLSGKEEISALFRMTPYFYHTPSQGMKRLDALDSLSTEIEFLLLVYGRGNQIYG